MDATQIIGIVLITFGVSTMVGAGFGFYTGYNKGVKEIVDEQDQNVRQAKRLAAYAYFNGGRN